MVCGSGFPAANLFDAGSGDRGWKAAPTIKPTPKILKLKCMRHRGNDVKVVLRLFTSASDLKFGI
jgi:hypothetical protein